jgi:tetratricopeptide (TPR) repeat protein
MFRLIPICLCLVLLGFMGTNGYAAKMAPQASSEEERSLPGETGDVAEARELMKKARALENHNMHYQAMTLYQQALKLREKNLGPEHPATLASMARLAREYSILGFFDQALPLAQQSLKLREKVLGPEHPQTAQSLMILGMLYGQMGAQDKAVQMTQRGLHISEKTAGQDNLFTAAALNNLAVLYSQMGSYDQALPLAQRAVQIREKVLGLENLQTAASLANLGFIYLSKRDYGQAEACFRRATHLKGDSGMVEIYLATGRYEPALDLLTTKLTPKAWQRPQYQALYFTQKGLALKGLGRREEACAAFLEAINNIEGLRARTPGERTSFFEFGLFGGYFRAYRGMVGLLAEMAQKGDPPPAGLTRYGPDLGASAFYFAEAIKARALLEALAAGATRVAPQVPPDLLAKEKNLQEQMQALDAQRMERMQERGARDSP